METRNSAMQHFSGTGAGTVTFRRSIQSLILTVSGGATTMSFDGGSTFMPVTNGTYQFTNISVKTMNFGAGVWAGIGIAL